LGFLGEDLTAIYDLKKPTSISSIRVVSLADEGSWIHGHRPVQLFESEDGITYKVVRVKKLNSGFAQTPPLQEAFYQCQTTTRFLKVVVPNLGTIPDGKPGAGHRAWLFVSEIIIE
jgi:hexosaminidase